MKIAIDARESGTTTGRYIDKLIAYLHGLNPSHEIIVLTKPDRVAYCQAIAPGFTVIESGFKEFTFSEQLGFRKQLQRLRADLVHFGMAQQPLMYQGRVVTTMHDLTTTRFRNPAKNWLTFTLKQKVYTVAYKIAAHKSVAILTPTEYVKQDICKFAHISPQKVTVTYEAADKITEVAEPISGLQGKRFIMYVGRPQPHKNLERLVRAFGTLKASHPDLFLVIAGKKDNLMQRTEQIANKQGIANVVFTGFVSEGQLRWLYENTQVYVFPSLSEGFGLPALEAMAHGAPVASSNATCLPEVYGDAAHYFDPQSPNDMAEKIKEVLDDTSLRQQLIQSGYAQIKKYSWERMAQQTLDVYQRVLSSEP